MNNILRGNIYLVDFGESIGSEQGGVRPAVVIQNNAGNKFAPTVIVLPLTSKSKKSMPTHLSVGTAEGLVRQSIIEGEQIRTIDKTRLIKYIGTFNQSVMMKINRIIAVSLGLQLAIA